MTSPGSSLPCWENGRVGERPARPRRRVSAAASAAAWAIGRGQVEHDDARARGTACCDADQVLQPRRVVARARPPPPARRSVRSPRRTSSATCSPGAPRVDVDPELAAVLHRLAVERDHDVAGLQAGGRRRAAGRDIRQDHAGVHRQTPSASASSGVIVCALTPISPRRTRPNLRICADDVLTMLLGAAKPMPSLPPDCVSRSAC